jgi:spore coat protein U-like protein
VSGASSPSRAAGLHRHGVRALAIAVFALSPVVSFGAASVVSCTISVVGGVAFGVYNPFSATPTYANGTVSASCTLVSGPATTATLVSSYTTGASGSYNPRTLVSGANVLDYNLYFDAAYTEIRGNGTGGSQTGGATFTLTPAAPTQSTSDTMYGRMPAGQNAKVGTYSDSITVTITY